MPRFTIKRTNIALPTDMAAARELLFRALDGYGNEDKKAWRRFWKRMINMRPGDIFEFEMIFPRSGPFHRRHMAIETKVFDAQDLFTDFEAFRDWLKVGAAWVVWVPVVGGDLHPIPKSISYAAADQAEFEKFHMAVMDFLTGPYAATVLWPHLGDGAHMMMQTVLSGFDG